MAISVDPDEMPHSAASHVGLHCLLSSNTYMSVRIHTVHVNTVLLMIIHVHVLLKSEQILHTQYYSNVHCTENCWMSGKQCRPGSDTSLSYQGLHGFLWLFCPNTLGKIRGCFKAVVGSCANN